MNGVIETLSHLRFEEQFGKPSNDTERAKVVDLTCYIGIFGSRQESEMSLFYPVLYPYLLIKYVCINLNSK